MKVVASSLTLVGRNEPISSSNGGVGLNWLFSLLCFSVLSSWESSPGRSGQDCAGHRAHSSILRKSVQQGRIVPVDANSRISFA